MHFITNHYDPRLIEELNKNLGLDLPIEPKHWITPRTMCTDVPIQIRLREILKTLTDVPYIHFAERYDYTGERNQSFYPSDWKLVPLAINQGRDYIVYANDWDYVAISNKEAKHFKSRGICKTIHRIMCNMNDPMSESDRMLYEFMRDEKQMDDRAIMLKLREIETMFENSMKVHVEVIFEGIEGDAGLIKEIMYKPSELDIFKLKVLYVLSFNTNPALDMVREYRGDNQLYQAETFIKACKTLLNLDISLDKIWINVEETTMDNLFLDIENYYTQFKDHPKRRDVSYLND